MRPTKNEIKFLVEEFLEQDPAIINNELANTQKIDHYWNMLQSILFQSELWMDEIDHEDTVNINKLEVIRDVHHDLQQIWNQFKNSISDYNNRVVPMRDQSKRLSQNIENEKSAPYYEYRELFHHSNTHLRERFYDVRIELRVTFDSGQATFFRRKIDTINTFLNILSDIPVSLLSQCKHCGKFIVLTRSDRKYCRGCAAKEHQKRKWKKDPEGMKRRERLRYHTKRKPSS